MSILAKFDKTDELKKSLTSILKQVHDKAYYKKAPVRADYPYITYYLKHTKTDNQYDYFWEVHVWTRDVKMAEQLADSIEGFDKYTYKNEYHCFDVDLNARNSVEDEDKEIHHIVLLFNLTYFDVKG